MKLQDKVKKIESVIESCKTYEHAQACLNLIKVLPNEEQYVLFGVIREKVYEFRRVDLQFHMDEMKRISKI